MIAVIDGILTDIAAPIGARYAGRVGNESWQISFEAQQDSIEIEYAPQRQLIILSTPLATPKADARANLYHLALQYNFLWNETGGARLSLDGPDGSLFLSIEIAVALISRAEIERCIRQTRAAATMWKTLVANMAATPGEAVEAAGDWRRV